MNNFDLIKFLAEGKLYKENLVNTRSEAEQDAQIFHKDLVVKYGFDNVADALEALYDNAEEGGAGYENISDLLKMDNSMLIDMVVDNLAEGKLYKENLVNTRSEAEQDAQIFHKDLVVKYGFDNVADALEALYDNAEEGGAGYENISDLLKMDNSMLIDMVVDNLAEGKEKSSKMKMSELKKKIRQEILAELTLSEDSEVDLNISDPDKEYDPLDEATKDKDGKVPSKDANTDIDIEDEVDIDVEEKPKAAGPSGDFLDQLEDLKDEADAMGDNKLERQIDNTITYFTRQHIAKDTNESLELEEDFGPAVQSTDPKAREIEKKIQDNPELQKQIAQIMAQAQKGGDTSKLLGMMTGLFEADELEEADDMALVADLEADLKEGYSEFQRADKGKKKTVARNKGEEEVYGAGVKKGEEIEKKKLKESVTFPMWNKIK